MKEFTVTLNRDQLELLVKLAAREARRTEEEVDRLHDEGRSTYRELSEANREADNAEDTYQLLRYALRGEE